MAGEALAREVAARVVGRVTSAPRKGRGGKGGAEGGGGAGESWRLSGGGGAREEGAWRTLGATRGDSGWTDCARSRRVLGQARPWKEEKENQTK